jgi:rSAM-partnered protein
MTDTNVNRVDEPRGDGTPEWEVFLREEPAEPLRHVGSVSAPTESVAYDHASSLFGWTAEAVWLCPAAAVARFTERDIGAAAADGAEAEPTAAGSSSEGDEGGEQP